MGNFSKGATLKYYQAWFKEFGHDFHLVGCFISPNHIFRWYAMLLRFACCVDALPWLLLNSNVLLAMRVE